MNIRLPTAGEALPIPAPPDWAVHETGIGLACQAQVQETETLALCENVWD